MRSDHTPRLEWFREPLYRLTRRWLESAVVYVYLPYVTKVASCGHRVFEWQADDGSDCAVCRFDEARQRFGLND